MPTRRTGHTAFRNCAARRDFVVRHYAFVFALRMARIDLLTADASETAMVKSALRRLVASKEVVDVDGMYSLAPSTVPPE